MSDNIVLRPNQTFEEKISEYVSKVKPFLYILTPCFGGLCFSTFVTNLMETVDLCKKLGIGVKIEFCNGDSLVSRARNNLIARAMANPLTTHMLFIDNDIGWNPFEVIKLLVSNKSLIGGLYPKKAYMWNRLVDKTNNTNVVESWVNKKNSNPIVSNIDDERIIQHKLLDYNFNFLTDDNGRAKMEIENNIGKVRHVATGFMMIQKNTIQQMMISYPHTKYVDDVGFLKPEEQSQAYALFDCEVREGRYLSEDWLFCDRWIQIGGAVHADISIILTHTGPVVFAGNFIASKDIMGQVSQSAPVPQPIVQPISTKSQPVVMPTPVPTPVPAPAPAPEPVAVPVVASEPAPVPVAASEPVAVPVPVAASEPVPVEKKKTGKKNKEPVPVAAPVAVPELVEKKKTEKKNKESVPVAEPVLLPPDNKPKAGRKKKGSV